jgi:hypothetical protein
MIDLAVPPWLASEGERMSRGQVGRQAGRPGTTVVGNETARVDSCCVIEIVSVTSVVVGGGRARA